jgi:asparagine synthase (glutamine-hydrolysing)
MCGIWFHFNTNSYPKTPYTDEELRNAFNNINSRGPNRSSFITEIYPYPYYLGFKRLAIMDISSRGDQPFKYEYNGRKVYMMCNGEIYNYHQLIKDHQLELELTSKSDCEVIILLYIKYGLTKTISLLQGEFAFIIVDSRDQKMIVHAVRDPVGVRPLFYSLNDDSLSLCSELKGIYSIANNIKPFPPGSYLTCTKTLFHLKVELESYYKFKYLFNLTEDKKEILKNIKDNFDQAVICRLVADRPLGCLLSGGLDSSLVSAIAANYLKQYNKKLKTFSIGMEGSTDLHYAQMVADYIGSDHTVINFTPKEALDAIPNVIKMIESYDITTVRASTVQYLLAKYISEKTDIKVILNGDYSDEVHGSYMYFHNAPSSLDAHNESVRLVKEIYLYDALRVDRTIAGHGLEARVPFSDVQYIDYYLSIDPELRLPRKSIELGCVDKKIEKALIREAYMESKLLPEKVLLRMKEAFSDGCSSNEKSWFTCIQEHVNTLITDDEFETRSKTFEHLPPTSKESLYYRELFEEYYGKENVKVIPAFWLPKWSGNVKDPSARVLKVYQDNNQNGYLETKSNNNESNCTS